MDKIYFGKVYRVVEDAMPEWCYRQLSEEEESDFIAWAKKQDEGVKVSTLWHPVVQNELLLSGRGVA